MRAHVQRTVLRCFSALRQLCSIQHSVPAGVFQSLVVSLVLGQLDLTAYRLLVGLLANVINRLQSVQNAAARL